MRAIDNKFLFDEIDLIWSFAFKEIVFVMLVKILTFLLSLNRRWRLLLDNGLRFGFGVANEPSPLEIIVAETAMWPHFGCTHMLNV